ncbi:hypothetical protein [Inediibacterium massiliense]|uniref:hypothetical protein n=1 Tax=Inediibacterium massiliense TaxID=1658111 RepID=UPI0006B67C03|nr:hypothetical protein [Inediibacterium massiliense]
MKKLLLYSLLSASLILSVGCSQKDNVTSNPSLSEDTITSVDKKSQSTDPQSTQDIIENVKNEMNSINQNLDGLDTNKSQLPPIKKEWEAQTLTLWSQNGKPVKLVVTEADDTGKMAGTSDYYFQNGQLIILRAPFAYYVFKDNKLVLWLNENMEPLNDIPQKDMEDAEKNIINYVNNIYLKSFK